MCKSLTKENFLKEKTVSKETLTKIFDTHAHYFDEKFNNCGEDILPEIKKTVCGIINCATNYQNCQTVASLANKHKGFFYSAFGVHPEELENEYNENLLKKYLSLPHCVAVGEIGLDYNFRSDNKQEQKYWFEKQIILANNLNMPVIVHDREAHNDTLELLKKYKPKGVVHCFSGSPETAKEILKLNMYIGVGGVVTFKNAKKLAETVKILPIEKILLETDAPYLAPEPFRGKPNRSDYIIYIAQKIAEIKGLTPEEILKQNLINTKNCFRI